MPTGLDSGFVDSPPDDPSFGAIQWESAGSGWGRSMAGGDWPQIGPGILSGENTGFERIATGIDLGEPVPGAAGAKVSDWRAAFNWEHNPTFWMIVASLVAVGFIHARLQVGGSVGHARAGGGVAV